MFRQQFKRIRLITDRNELNPLLCPDDKATLTVVGITKDGQEIAIPSPLVKFDLTTLLTCQDAKVATVDANGIVTPVNGGYVKVTATYVGVGIGLTDSVKLVVRPFYHEYHKTLTYKLFLAQEPFGTSYDLTDTTRDDSVVMDIDEAADCIRRLDNLTAGIPKIVYLVGWQLGGHDHLYPSFAVPNPRLKRPGDPDARESIRWLMREGRKYNTAVSFHINSVDAYEDSPLWDEYHALHILKENPDGSVAEAVDWGLGFKEKYGVLVGLVSQRRLVDTGMFQKRMEELLELFPELYDAHTIHLDNWRMVGFPTMGIEKQDDENAMCEMFRYMRQIGLDATSEGSFYGRNEPMTGLQPMTYWDTPYHPSIMPASLYCGGRHKRTDSDPRFGDSIHVELTVLENLRRGFDPMEGLSDQFCLYTLTWQFLNNFPLEKFDGEVAQYSDDVSAYLENGVPVIRWGNTTVQHGNTMFVPMLWSETPSVMLYSLYGNDQFSTVMPRGWEDVSSVDLYYVDRLGREQPKLEFVDHAIRDGRFAFTLRPRCTYVLRPHTSAPASYISL